MSRHPDYLLDSLSSEQIAGWVAWLRREPRGDQRQDIRMALLRSDIRAPYISGPDDPEDLIPDLKYEPESKLDPETDALLNRLLAPVALL